MQKSMRLMVGELTNTGYVDKHGNFIFDEDFVLFYPSDNEFLMTFVAKLDEYGYCLVAENEKGTFVAYPVDEQPPMSMVICNNFTDN